LRRADAAAGRPDEIRRRVSARVAADGDRLSGGIDVARVHRPGEPRGNGGAVSARADLPAAGRCDAPARTLAIADTREDQGSRPRVKGKSTNSAIALRPCALRLATRLVSRTRANAAAIGGDRSVAHGLDDRLHVR